MKPRINRTFSYDSNGDREFERARTFQTRSARPDDNIRKTLATRLQCMQKIDKIELVQSLR